MAPFQFSGNLIAPCGMNCGICVAHLRQNNPCHGCRDATQNKPKTRLYCGLRLCRRRRSRFCWNCAAFPCDRLKRLDERYRRRYGMSQIENLEYIRDKGLEKFLDRESKRWVKGQCILCVHNRQYYFSGLSRK